MALLLKPNGRALKGLKPYEAFVAPRPERYSGRTDSRLAPPGELSRRAHAQAAILLTFVTLGLLLAAAVGVTWYS